MSFFLKNFCSAAFGRLRSWKTWILVLLLVAFSIGVRGSISGQEAAAPVQVGVVLSDDAGKPLWDALSRRSGAVVHFVLTDKAQLEAKISTGQWDCGILVPENFSEMLETGRTRHLIQLYISDSSAVYPLVQETVSACLTELAAPFLAKDYLVRQQILSREAADQLLYEVLDRDSRVLVSMENLSGKPLDPRILGESHLSRVSRGIPALLLLVYCLYLSLDLGMWCTSGFGKRLCALRHPLPVLASRALGAAAPVFSAALLCICLAPGRNFAIPALLSYEILLLALTVRAARIPGLTGLIPVLTPFVVLAGALLSPVFVDAASLFPGGNVLTGWLPVTLFLHAGEGSLGAFAGLWAEIAILLIFPGFSRRSS